MPSSPCKSIYPFRISLRLRRSRISFGYIEGMTKCPIIAASEMGSLEMASMRPLPPSQIAEVHALVWSVHSKNQYRKYDIH